MAPPSTDDRATPPERPLEPSVVVGLLAEPLRLRVFAAIALGARSLAEVAGAAGVSLPAASRAAGRLARGRLVIVEDDPVAGRTFRVAGDRLATAARAAPRRPATPLPGDGDLSPAQRQLLAHFFVNGRLTSVPVNRTKRLVVLDYLAGRFDPGRTYPEKEVNFLLGMLHADFAALRRYLVDEGFLERRDGFYWRAGGTYPVD